MRKLSQDSLLPIARIVLAGLTGLTLLIALAALAAIPYLLVRRPDFTAYFDANGFEPSTFWRAETLLVLIVAMTVLTFFFLRKLRSIVISVAEGDPFVPDNAERLLRMAWLSIPIQVLLVPMTRIAVWFDAAPQAPNVHHDTDGISIGSLLLTLTLFILARVFREGTRLRDEVEGTV